MKYQLLKVSPVAALLMVTHHLAFAQDPAPKDGNAATAEAADGGLKAADAGKAPAAPNTDTPAAAEKPPMPKEQPADGDDPVLPKLAADLKPPAPVPPVAGKVAPQNSGDSKLDMAFTTSRDADMNLISVNLAGITLVVDKRNSASETPTQWEQSEKEAKLAPGVQLMEGLNTPDPERLRSALDRYITAAKPATFRDLQQMVEIIEDHYRKHNRPMTHVYIPRQSLFSDKVVIAIVEGRIGETMILTETDVRNKPASQRTAAEKSYIARMDAEKNWWNSWYNNPYSSKDVSEEFLPRTAPLKGRIVDTEEIRAQIAGMNRSPWARLNRPVTHPFRDVTANFSQPDANIVGQTNLIFEVDDQRPLKFFTGVDNTLTDPTGNNRFFLGAAWYDAFGLGKNHEMGIQLFSALEPEKLMGFSLNYQIPWQNQKYEQFTEFFTTYADSTTPMDYGGIPVDAGGSSFIFGGRHYLELPELLGASDMTQPLGANREFKWANPIREPMGLHHEVGLGFDFKMLDNTLQFGGTTASDSPADIFQLVLEYNARQTDPSGETFLGSQLVFSPGDMTDNNTTDAYEPLRSEATADYFYARVRLEREQDLPFSGYFSEMMVRAALTGQYSSTNLLASEQLGLGGFDSVRGYPERILRGDTGFVFNLELYSPPYHPARSWFKSETFDELKFLTFFDYAHGEPYKENLGDPLDDPADLMSFGVGIRYNYNDVVKLRLDYGIRIEDLPAAADNTDDGAFHFGLVGTF